MAGPDNFYSAFIGWSKILLPTGAVVLLSVLFLLARAPAQNADIPMAEIEQIAREQRISAPRFSGVTRDGAIIAIGARVAAPDPAAQDRLNIDDITLQMDNPDGSSLRIAASQGAVSADEARLFGLARLETSTGYVMETNGLTADIDSGTITSEGKLEVRAPFGQLTAGRVTFSNVRQAAGQQMLFSDGVKLIYTPQDE